jgi:transposase
MNAHLAEISRSVAPGAHAHAVLVLDGAGWHGSAALVVPDNLSLLTLPPYSPELGRERLALSTRQLARHQRL